MNNHRTARLFWFLFAVLGGLSVASNAQPKSYMLHKFQPNGTVTKSMISQLDQHVKFGAGEKLAVIRTGDSIRVVKSMVSPPPGVISRRAFAIPETYYAMIEGTEDQVTLSPMLISDGPMRYNKSTSRFHGLLLVTLNESGQTQSRKLSQPVSFTVASDADSVSPRKADIDHSNLPALELLFASLNPADSVQVTFITSTNPQGYRTFLPVEPNLTIHTAHTVLQGFGIERTNLTVSLKPPGPGQSHAIHASASQGSLDPEELHLEGGQALTQLRSGGLGNAKITLTSPH